jgi:hypothetical protein
MLINLDLTGGSQMVTKSLFDFSRFFKEGFLDKINSKFGFLVKKYQKIVCESVKFDPFLTKIKHYFKILAKN